MDNEKQIKVAAIINHYSLIINAGINDNLNVGDRINVIDTIGSVIKDPDTGKKIGTYPLTKARLVVTKTYPEFSICETQKELAGIHIAAKSLYTSIDTLNPREKFEYEGKSLTDNNNLSTAPVKVGDIIELVK